MSAIPPTRIEGCSQLEPRARRKLPRVAKLVKVVLEVKETRL